MKTTKPFGIAAVITVAVLLTFAACAQPEPPSHTHTYEEAWTSDDTHHWHKATCEHTTEVSGKAAHVWNDGKVTTEADSMTEGVKTYTCTVCNTTKTETIQKVVLTGTSEDGMYLYEVKEGVLTVEYKGSDNPAISIQFFIPDSTNEEWPWKDIYYKNFIYDKKISMNILDSCWDKLWAKFGKRPENSDMLISFSNLGKFIETKFIVDEAFLDSKDYSKKTFTPKDMAFKEEDAFTAVEKMKMAIGLSDFFTPYTSYDSNDLPPAIWEKDWMHREVTLEHIKYLKSLGFTAVRLAVTWGNHMDENDIVYPSWMNRIQEVVDWCMDEDMYVVMNTMFDSGDMEFCWIFANEASYNANSARYQKLWEQIADRFKNYSEKLIFSSSNEICKDSEWGDGGSLEPHQVMLKWNQLLVDTVRKSGGHNDKRNIAISALNTSDSEETLSKTYIPTDTVENHLIFEIHTYEPRGFVYPDKFWTPVATFEESGFDANKILDPAYNFSKQHNIPIIIGEWGFEPEHKLVVDAERGKYSEVFVSEALKRGIAPFLWWGQWYTGYTSIDDVEPFYDGRNLSSPLFLKAIQDAVANTKFGSYIPPAPIEPDYTIDLTSKAGTYTFEEQVGNGHFINIDITDQFTPLPKKGDTVKLSFKGTVNKNVNSLSIYLVDNSAAANGWINILGGFENRANIDGIKANTQFTVDKLLTIENAPKEKVLLWIDYYLDWFNEGAELTIE